MTSRKMTSDQIAITERLKERALIPGGRNVITTTHVKLIREARAAKIPVKAIARLLNINHVTVIKYSSDRQQAREIERQRQRHLTEAQKQKCRERALRHYWENLHAA